MKSKTTYAADFSQLSPTVRPAREYGLPPGGETSVRQLCDRAAIPYRVTGGYQPVVFEDTQSYRHIKTKIPDGRWALIVGTAALPAEDPEHAVRMLEILAHCFHDYAARESVRGLFSAPVGKSPFSNTVNLPCEFN